MSEKRREDRRARYTEKVIIDAYLQLLEQKPKNKIRVTEICALAEINRCTFYLHFSDINEVEAVIQQNLLKKLQAHVRTQMASSKNRIQLSNMFTEQILNDPAYLALVKLSQPSTPFQKELLQFFEKDLLASLPEHSRLTDRQKHLLYLFIAGGISAVYQDWVSNGHEHLKEDNQMMDLITHRLLSIEPEDS